ncbi:hypothetical protein C0995_016112 [Termitomyces sp. Mi166|nr:hypothetical protein C0995_016112 [Termitomyces sp. Mi166\
MALLSATLDSARHPPLAWDVDDTQRRGTGDRRRPITTDKIISTLDPKKLDSSDFVDLSGRKFPSIIADSIGSCEIRYGWHARHEPFPINTRGFLYYHLPPNLPPTCGQIRFRVTTNDDPGQFERGTDLIGLDATPWSISTFSLMCPLYEILRKQLLRDQLITRAFVDTMVDLQKKYGVSKTSPREMYYLEQPFMFDMSMRVVTFRLVTASKVCGMKLTKLFADHREAYRTDDPYPYQGRLLLRFERSTLAQHHGTRDVVLRVLKVLDPITLNNPAYDAYVPLPEAGTLLLLRKLSEVFVLSWNLEDENDQVSSALQILPSNQAEGNETENGDDDELKIKIDRTSLSLNLSPSPSLTFDPELLTPSDFVALEGRIRHPKFPESYLFYEGKYPATAKPFPKGTRGFLYYYCHPSLPPTFGELRFRVTYSDNPMHFRSGHDLVTPSKTRWSIGLSVLTHRANRDVLQCLLEDGLVTQEVIDAVLKAPDTLGPVDAHQKLHYLEQPFEIKMDAESTRVDVVLNDKAKSIDLRNLFVVTTKEGSLTSIKLPYVGTLLVCFERSTLPQHKGRNMVVLRVLQFLKRRQLVIPKLKGSVPMPVKGSFLETFILGGPCVLAWDLDDDTSSNSFSCLKLLPSVTPKPQDDGLHHESTSLILPSPLEEHL